MRLFHEHWRRQTSLLAAGCLEEGGRERAEALAHVGACPSCGQAYRESLAALQALAADPVRTAEPPVPLPFLVSRVQARLDSAARPRGWRWSWALASLAVAGALAVIVPRAVVRPPAASEPVSQEILLSEDSLQRLERNVAREQTVRYLNEAQDVLVTVASSPRNCDRQSQRIDMAQEAQRSRELLASRTLLVELNQDAVASARLVIEDVDTLLREVARLEACARPMDLDAINREISRRQLLMKIDLMTRELTG